MEKITPTLPKSMMAVCYGAAGSEEVIDYVPVPIPVPKEGEVLIRVEAAGMNRADIIQRQGHYPPPAGASDIPGLEVAGTIVAAGPGTSPNDFHIGDRVCALLAGGGYAEYVAVPVGQVLPVPDSLSMTEAGAIMEVACTVVSNLVLTVPVRSGQWVLIHGGSGGIGTFALQFLKRRGAKTIATVSSVSKAAWAKEQGADYVIDYTAEDFVQRVREITGSGADVILDVVGAKYLERNLEALADGGRLVIIGLVGGSRAELNLGLLLSKRAGVIATALRSRTTAEKIQVVTEVGRTVWPMLAARDLQVRVDRTFPLETAAQAQAYFDSGEHRGKVVLLPEVDR